MHSRLFVMAVALIISALATVSTSFAVAEFHSDVMLFYAEYIVLFTLLFGAIVLIGMKYELKQAMEFSI